MKSALSLLIHKYRLRTVFLVTSLFVLFFATFSPILIASAAPEPQQNPSNQAQDQNQNPNNQQNNNQGNQQNQQNAEQQQVENELDEGQSCDDVAGPLSFFFCPILDQVMKLIDWMVGPEDSILTNMLDVEPLQFNQDEGLYKAYQNVLNFANSLFIIVFLVIIFANLIRDFTFLDNYNVKSTLPRFIAAVILAQFGYFIVAIAIDFGNILGVYAPKMITDGVLGPNVAVPTLTDGVTGLLAFGGSNPLFSLGTGTVVFLLLLIMAIMAAGALFIALIYMVARYLILVILIFATPLAFLAWVLPGTQGFFYKWGKNLTQLILMFPIVTILITTASVVSFMLLHPTLDPNVLTDDVKKRLIGGLIPFVALLMIPKCLKLSGDIMAVTGGAVAGYVAGKSKEGAKAGSSTAKESVQNRVASNDNMSASSFGRVIVAGPSGVSKKSAKATAKMGATRDRAQSVYDKAAALGTSDELKNMMKQKYQPAKVAALVALAKRGDRDAVKTAFSDPSYGMNKSILNAATTKDFGAFDKMPDMRGYYDTPAEKQAAFANMNAKGFGDVSPATMRDWIGTTSKNAQGVKVFSLDSNMMNQKFTPAQMRSFLTDKNVRSGISEDIRIQLGGYGGQGNNSMQQAIQSNLDQSGSWL